MVALDLIRKSNALVANLAEGRVALFLGGTSGIGKAAMLQLAEYAVRPRIYVVARAGTDTAGLLATLRTKNPQGTYTVIEKELSLIRETDEVVEFVKAHETHLDLLFLSVGFLSFAGRQDTAEGLDASMATRYYARVRAIQGLLPLLNAAPHPRVVSVLAAGQEAAINEDDLDLRKPGNYSIGGAAAQVIGMLGMALERFALANPKISFVNSFPGFVATPIFSKGSTGLLAVFMAWVVQPLINLFATSADDAGARALFYATSARYSVDDEAASDAVPLVESLSRAVRNPGGVFLVNDKSEDADNEKVLADFRKRSLHETVWKHTTDIFDAIVAKTATP